MAQTKTIPIYKPAFDLLSMSIDVTRSIPRDFNRLFGEEIRKECVGLMLFIFKANSARDKVPYIEKLLERIQVVELLLRVSFDKKWISHKQYANAIKLTDNIGKQAMGWKKYSAANRSPDA
jgi:hypothetical protein